MPHAHGDRAANTVAMARTRRSYNAHGCREARAARSRECEPGAHGRCHARRVRYDVQPLSAADVSIQTRQRENAVRRHASATPTVQEAVAPQNRAVCVGRVTARRTQRWRSGDQRRTRSLRQAGILPRPHPCNGGAILPQGAPTCPRSASAWYPAAPSARPAARGTCRGTPAPRSASWPCPSPAAPFLPWRCPPASPPCPARP